MLVDQKKTLVKSISFKSDGDYGIFNTFPVGKNITLCQ